MKPPLRGRLCFYGCEPIATATYVEYLSVWLRPDDESHIRWQKEYLKLEKLMMKSLIRLAEDTKPFSNARNLEANEAKVGIRFHLIDVKDPATQPTSTAGLNSLYTLTPTHRAPINGYSCLRHMRSIPHLKNSISRHIKT